MSLERYLAGIERVELNLFRQLNALKVLTHKESQTARNTRYLGLCTVTLLSSLSAVLRILIQAIKSIFLSLFSVYSETGRDTRPMNPPLRRLSDDNPPGPLVGIDILIETGKESQIIHKLRPDGETFVATSSASPFIATKGGIDFIVLPSSDHLPPVTVLVRTTGGRVYQSKLIFQSSRKTGLKVFRKFGMDEMPTKPTENINLNTDRVVIGEISVRFQPTILHRASSAPS